MRVIQFEVCQVTERDSERYFSNQMVPLQHNIFWSLLNWLHSETHLYLFEKNPHSNERET